MSRYFENTSTYLKKAGLRRRFSLVLTAALATLMALPVLAQPGSLDPDFGIGGRFRFWFDEGGLNADKTTGAALQADGKIIIVGYASTDSGFDATVARVLPDGDLDLTFESDGQVVFSFDAGGPNNDFLYGVAIQPDGKIVVVGTMSVANDDEDIVLYRLNADGSSDNSFGAGGLVQLKTGMDDDPQGDNREDAAAIALQADGKVVVYGITRDPASGVAGNFVARLNTNGSLDSTFAGDGRLAFRMDDDDQARALAIQSDGRILVVGYSDLGNSNIDCTVARILTNGSLDASFDGDGKLLFPFNIAAPWADRCSDVHVLPDGKILIGASVSADANGNRDYAIAKLLSDGARDLTFAGNGRMVVPMDLGVGTRNDDVANSLVVQSDGKIILGGTVQEGALGFHYGVVRVLADGSAIDTGFGTNGRATFGFNFLTDDDDSLQTLLLRTDEKIIAVGDSLVSSGNDYDVTVARLRNGPSEPPLFADGFESGNTSAWQ